MSLRKPPTPKEIRTAIQVLEATTNSLKAKPGVQWTQRGYEPIDTEKVVEMLDFIHDLLAEVLEHA